MFKAPFSFNGRIRRLEYGLSFAIYVFAIMMISFLSTVFLSTTTTDNSDTEGVLSFVFMIPCIWFVLAQGAKRSHDLGNSGWFILIPFYVFWLLFADSKHGENEYGLNPKGIGNETGFSFENEQKTY